MENSKVKQCPYYDYDDILKDFPKEQCDNCEHRKYDHDEGLLYCGVISNNAHRGPRY